MYRPDVPSPHAHVWCVRQADVWQWEWVHPTIFVVNGSDVTINVTRNYTYWVSTKRVENTRPLLRFQWTQSIPLLPALPVHRDCFIFDYTARYKAGAIDPSHFEAPPGVTCRKGGGALRLAGREKNLLQG